MWFSKSKQEILIITLRREQAMNELKDLNLEQAFTFVFDGDLYSLYVTQPVSSKKKGAKDAKI